MQKAEKLLKDYGGIVKSYAVRLSKKWGIPADDVIGEAYLLFCEAVEKFDESRGVRFNTFLTHQLKALTAGSEYKGKYYAGPHSICRLEIKQKAFIKNIDDFEFITAELSFVRLAEFKSLVKTLSPDSRLLLQQIFKTGEQVKLPAAQYYFKEVYKWAKSRTATAWAELREFWNTFNTSYAGY